MGGFRGFEYYAIVLRRDAVTELTGTMTAIKRMAALPWSASLITIGEVFSANIDWKCHMACDTPMLAPKRTFMISYDYGMGGVWAVVTARTALDITSKFPEVKVFEEDRNG